MALQLQPASGHPYELMGYSQLERKEFLKAILSFDSAISKDKTLYKAYVNKAAALSHLSRYAEALTVLDQVITLKPDYLLEHKFRLQQVTGDLTGDLSTLILSNKEATKGLFSFQNKVN